MAAGCLVKIRVQIKLVWSKVNSTPVYSPQPDKIVSTFCYQTFIDRSSCLKIKHLGPGIQGG